MRKLVRNIKKWFEGGNWTREQVELALKNGKITQEEFAEIVGAVKNEDEEAETYEP